MDSSEADFLNKTTTSRIKARPIVAGVMTALATMVLLMSLAAALGLWAYNFMEFTSQNAGSLWAWTFASWVISISVGSHLASVAGHSYETGNGILHGVVVWATSTIFGFTFLAFALGSFEPLSYAPWGTFICNVLALGASFVGGVSGTHQEQRLTESKRHRTEHAFNAP